MFIIFMWILIVDFISWINPSIICENASNKKLFRNNSKLDECLYCRYENSAQMNDELRGMYYNSGFIGSMWHMYQCVKIYPLFEYTVKKKTSWILCLLLIQQCWVCVVFKHVTLDLFNWFSLSFFRSSYTHLMGLSHDYTLNTNNNPNCIYKDIVERCDYRKHSNGH